MSQVSPQRIKALVFEIRQLLPEQSNVALAKLLDVTPAAISKWTKGKTSDLKEETKAQIVSVLGCPREALDEFLTGARSWDELKAACSMEAIRSLGEEEAAASKESFFKRIEQLSLGEAIDALQAIAQRLTTLSADANSHRRQEILKIVETLSTVLDVDFLVQLGERVQMQLADRLKTLEERMQRLGLLEYRPHQHNPLFRKLEEYRLDAGLSREGLAHQLYEKSGGRFDRDRAAAIAAGTALPDNGEVLWVGCLLKNRTDEFYTHDELLALRAGDVDFFSGDRLSTEEDARLEEPQKTSDRDLEARGGNGIK